ncbi:MAG: hypothetical protein GXP39_10765 [Chloroflexi bacterium]|nr:hypothetical protein [Chloroflexota bacterium]
MSQIPALTEAQQAAIKQYLDAFRRYMATEAFQRDQAERQARVEFFQQELPRRLDELSEADFEAIINRLWASAMWGNKTYLAQKIVNDNGIDRLRSELKRLVESDDPEQAYSRFLRAIKGMGPASVTEILTYLRPERCGIWNRQAREALKILGITDRVNPDKYMLSAQEYRTFNWLLQLIAQELARAGVPDVDLLLVDFFLYEVAQAKKVRAETGLPEPLEGAQPTETFDHDEVRDLIVQIGAGLGFDTDTEVKVAHGAVVDAVWRARIANLGLVTYVFEVHRSGSIDSLILNLQKARSAPSVQKVIAVSDEDQLERIRRECEGLPEEFRQALRFWPVTEVLGTAEHLQRVMESIDALGLIEDGIW